LSGILEEMRRSAEQRLKDLPGGEPGRGDGSVFPDALRGRERLSVIAEVKRSSPSEGALKPGADAVAQASLYAGAGAAAVSVLTEPTRFGGALSDLEQVAAAVDIPVLMKDFVIDPDQVRAGALLGARAVLVIARLLDEVALDEILHACDSYGVAPFFETHDAVEAEAGCERAVPVIGVNNRDLDTLEIDLGNARRLLGDLPREVVTVAESGYVTVEDARDMIGRCDAILVGTALMRDGDPGAFIRGVSR